MATNNATNTSNPITVAQGGTGRNTLTNHGVLVGATTSAVTQLTAGTNGQLLVGSTGADPVFATPGSTDSTVTWTTGAGTISAQVNQANLTSVSGAQLVLIQSQSASNSASIAFTNLTTYTNLFLLMTDIQPITNTASLQLLVSQDNGSSYLASSYLSSVLYRAYNSTTFTNSSSTTFAPLTGPLNSGDTCAGYMYIYNMNIGSFFEATGQAVWNDTTLGTYTFGTIGTNATTGINAFKFQMSSGNINTGKFTLYGIKET